MPMQIHGTTPLALLLMCGTAFTQQSVRITGRAIDSEGKPVPGAVVGLFDSSEFIDTVRFVAERGTTTDRDGRYRLEAAVAKDRLVCIAAPGAQPCAIRIVSEAEEVNLLDALVLPGKRLSGRVRDDAGAPLAGARVSVTNGMDATPFGEARLLAGTRTDARGIFSIDGVPETGLRVAIAADGYIATDRLAAQHTPLDVTLQRSGFVAGRVLGADGRPVPGIRVHPVTVQHRARFESAISDVQGRFQLTVPNRGRYRLQAYEQRPPHRHFSSGLLRGAHANVEVAPKPVKAPDRQLTVRVVDADSKAPIDEFSLSWQKHWDPRHAGHVQSAVMWHSTQRKNYKRECKLSVPGAEAPKGTVIVDAAGYGFEVIAMPEAGDDALTVELRPERAVVGRAIDATTGKPMPNVAVRVLPVGGAMGGGGNPRDCGVITDAEGRYRAGGLKSGRYVVQAYGPGRPASTVSRIAITDQDVTVDVTVPVERWLTFELLGDVPPGPAPRLSFQSASSFDEPDFFPHFIGHPQAVSVRKPGAFRIGPVGDGEFTLSLWRPSRVRLGAGVSFGLGEIDPDGPKITVELPDLQSGIVRGRVELPDGVPTERIGVVLRVPSQRDRALPWTFGQNPAAAGVDAGGGFVLDIPRAAYTLQLVDLATGIFFHTEPEDLELGGARAEPLVVRPAVHWLEIELGPERNSDPVIAHSFAVQVARPRGGECSALMRAWRRTNNIEWGSVPCTEGATQQRWLVPAGRVEVAARQTFEILSPWSDSWRARDVDSAAIEIANAVHRVRLTVKAPPTDAEILGGGR